MLMVHCRINLDEFWVKNCRFGTTDPKNHAISENFANSEILQAGHAPGALIAQASNLVNVLLACWPILGPAVHSEAFLSSYYNFITPKQHLSNAHNIK